MHDGHPVEVLHSGAKGDVLEKVRDHADVGDRPAHVLQHLEHRAVRVQGERQEDGVDRVRVDQARRVARHAENGQAAILGVPLVGRVVQESDGAQAGLGMLEELVHDRLAEAPRAHDQHAADAHAVPPGLLEVAPDRRPSREDEEHVQPEKQEEDQPRVREAAVERREPRQQQRRQASRDQDREALVDARSIAADLIEAVEVEDQGPEDGDQREEPVVGGGVGNPLRDGNDLGPEAQEVGARQGEKGREDVRGDEHGGDASRRLANHRRTSSSAPRNSSAKRSGRNASVEARREV